MKNKKWYSLVICTFAVLLGIFLLGASDDDVDFNKIVDGSVKCYSGGVLIYEGEIDVDDFLKSNNTIKIARAYSFRDKKIEYRHVISADCIFTVKPKK